MLFFVFNTVGPELPATPIATPTVMPTPLPTSTPIPTVQSGLDSEAQERIIKVNADILLGSDDFAKEEERARIQEQIRGEFGEYDGKGRAGFVLVWGYAPTINEGNKLAEEVNQLLEPALEKVFKSSARKELHWVTSDLSQRGDVRLEVYFLLGGP